MSIPIVQPSRIGILLIDAQPFFWDSIHGAREPVLVRLECLLKLAHWLKLPLIATFEHPVETKGFLPERLERAFPPYGQRFVKRDFNCCSDRTIRQAIKALQIKQVALAGAETDVCILQSALGLLRMGVQVFLLEDCAFTSEHHPRPALERMYNAGVIPCTLKTLFYELTRTVDKDELPVASKVEAASVAEHFDLEALPPWDRAD